MGPWGFVFLAYALVWGAIACYAVGLKRRYERSERELAQLDASEHSPGHAKE